MNNALRPSIRKILVPLDPSEYASSATDYACRVAHAHQAKVSGLTVLDSPEIRSSVIPSQYGYMQMAEDLIKQHKELAEKKLEVVEKTFTERCFQEHLISSEVLQEGIPVDLILEAATLFDLMVVGLRTFFHFETRNNDGELLSKILDRSSTPVLAVPKESRELKKVLIAYDGSPASARAVRDFVLFALPMDVEVDLFLANEDGGELDFHASKLRYYLNDHEIPVNEIIRSSESPLQAIENGLTKKYDLIVCGLHARRPLHDFFVGSFARRLIEKEENALFLSH